MGCYNFTNATFTDGLKHILIPAELIELDGHGVLLKLPDYSFESAQRKIKRFNCKDISAQISQDGWIVKGSLLNFTAQSLAVNFHHQDSLLKDEIDAGSNFHLVLKKDNEFISTWEKAVGKDISKHTKPRSFKSGRLVVNVSDSSRLYELTLKKHELIKDINRRLKDIDRSGQSRGGKPKGRIGGKTRAVKEIRFRIGEV